MARWHTPRPVSSRPAALPPHGFAKLRDVAGRRNDFLITSGGGIVHASRLDAMFRYQCAGIRRFQVHQKRDGAINVFVELYQPATETKQQIEGLRFHLAGYPVAVQVVEEIQQTRAGKQRILLSELAKAKLARNATQ